MPEPILIDDPNDPRIEPFRAIRDRDLTGREGFMAEGSVVLDQLLVSTRFRPLALLVLRNRLANLLPRLAGLPDEVPLYVADQEVFDRIAGFPVHRGVMAFAGSAGTDDECEAALRGVLARRGTVVVACGIANHDNMGAIFRNAAALGAGAVLLDERACDPLYRKAIRVSVGAVLTVPFWRLGDTAEIHARLSAMGFDCLALSPSGDRRLDAITGIRPRALFLGTEGDGLERDFLEGRDSVRIAMVPGLDSLNVATSAAIALHHFLSLQGYAAGARAHPRLA